MKGKRTLLGERKRRKNKIEKFPREETISVRPDVIMN